MDPTEEHRKHPRFLVRFKSIFSTDGMHLEDGLVLDLSLGGCRLMTVHPVPPGLPIELSIRPDQHAQIYVPSAVVCWERNLYFGLAFKELSELELATLTRLLWTLRA